MGVVPPNPPPKKKLFSCRVKFEGHYFISPSKTTKVSNIHYQLREVEDAINDVRWDSIYQVTISGTVVNADFFRTAIDKWDLTKVTSIKFVKQKSQMPEELLEWLELKYPELRIEFYRRPPSRVPSGYGARVK